jgi:hypothetical protein
MEMSLNKDSVMECPRHGLQRPTFVCKHLQSAEGLGFNRPDIARDPDWPFENAWCDKCDEVLNEEGEWNERSEKFAGIIAICEGCFKEIEKRNTKDLA